MSCEIAKARRDELRAGGYCINGKSHGTATHGCRCAWCADVHKRGVEKVRADPNAPAPPPDYKFNRVPIRDVTNNFRPKMEDR